MIDYISKEYLNPSGINQKSFYKKAYIETYNGFKLLYSYNVLVATIINQNIWNDIENLNNLLEILHEKLNITNETNFHYKNILINNLYQLRYISNENYSIYLPVIFNLQSATTLRHVKSFLHANNINIESNNDNNIRKKDLLTNCVTSENIIV